MNRRVRLTAGLGGRTGKWAVHVTTLRKRDASWYGQEPAMAASALANCETGRLAICHRAFA